MNKTKLLTIAVIVLVVINLSALSFFISNKPPHGMGERREMPREIVIRKLHFDEQQTKQYELLIDAHRKTVDSLDNTIKGYKGLLYKQLSATNTDEKEQLLLQIATTQATIEKLHFNHFVALKKLCKPDQLDDYNELTNELAKIFSPKLPPQDLNRAP